MRLEAAKVNITVNQKSITAVFNDNKVNNELLITFNTIIDEELKKEAFKVAFKQDAYLKRWRKLLGTTFNKHTL